MSKTSDKLNDSWEGEEGKESGQEEDDLLGAKAKPYESPPATKSKKKIKEKEHPDEGASESLLVETSNRDQKDEKGEDDADDENTKSKQKRGSRTLAPSDGEETSEETCPEFFGVRSYLHTFYETVTVKNPQLYEDIYEEDLLYLTRSRKRHRSAIFWKMGLTLGIIMIVFGIVLLLVGYLIPRRHVVVSYQEDMEIIDRDALDFNDRLNLCRVIGLAVFCCGGTMFCAILLLPVLSNIQCDDDGGGETGEAFRVLVAPQDPPQTPTEKKIPATEELASIQPKRGEEEEMVMTNSGLCKAP